MPFTSTSLPHVYNLKTDRLNDVNNSYTAVNDLTARAVAKGDLAMNLRDQAGVVGDGTADDASAINAACTSAATLGLRVYATGTFKIGSTVTVTSDADLSGATFSYTGSGVAVQVGVTGATFRRRVALPKVLCPTKTTTGWSQVAGRVGVLVQNCYNVDLIVPHIQSFETGLRIAGASSNGTSYCTVMLGHLDNNKVSIQFTADSTGWANQNTLLGGRLTHNSNEGSQVTGTRHVVFGNSTNIHNGNVFIGTSLESPDVVEYHIECYGQYNTFRDCRFENTGGDTHRRVYSRGSAKANLIDRGFNAGQITQVLSDTARQFDIRSDITNTWVGGTSTAEVIRMENANSSTAPALVIMEAGANAAGTAPSTGYAVSASAQKWSGKRGSDSFDRVQLDTLNGRLYLSDGLAAPVVYWGGSANAMFLGGAKPLYMLADNTQDIGATASNRPRYVRCGTAVVTGAAVTGSRPAAATAGAGAMFFDTTLGKPIWSTGSGWVDATGATA